MRPAARTRLSVPYAAVCGREELHQHRREHLGGDLMRLSLQKTVPPLGRCLGDGAGGLLHPL